MIKALILAGGATSGLLPLTTHTPKPILPIANMPLLLYQIDRLKRAGITEVILSLSHAPRKIREVFDDGSRFGILLRYLVESRPLGTAGAFRKAANLIDDTAVVLNGDVLADFSIQQLLEHHRSSGGEATIAACRVRKPQAYGVLETDESGRVTQFLQRPRGRQVRTNLINAGIYVVQPGILDRIPGGGPVYFETEVFPEMLRRGDDVAALEFRGSWLEVTRPANYLQSNLDVLDGRIAAPEFAALPRQHVPPSNPSAAVDGSSLLAADCVFKPGVRIVHSVIGAGCRIEEGAFVRNSVLWPGCRVMRDAVISGSVLGRGCQVGEGAYLKSGAILGDKSMIAAYSRA